jgi:RecB family exonuclease
MLNLVIGPFERLEKALAERLRTGGSAPGAGLKPVIVVTPSWVLNRRLQSRFVSVHGLALAGVRFHTFQSFSRELLLSGGISVASIADDPAADEGLLEWVLARSGMPAFGPLIDTPGLLGSLRGSITDMEEALVDPVIVAEALRAEPGKGAGLERLLPLLEGVRRRRTELRIIGRTGGVHFVSEGLVNGSLKAAEAAVHIYGAYDLTPHLVEFVAALSSRFESTCWFPASTQQAGALHPAWRFAEQTRSEIMAKSGEPEWLSGPDGGPLGGRLNHLMSGEPVPPGLRPPGLRLVEAPGPEEEIDAVAVECLRLIAEEKYRPSDIVVVARSLDGLAGTASQVFSARGLPFHTPARLSISSLPLGQALLSLVDVLSGDFGPAPVVSVVTSRWLEQPGGPLALTRSAALAGRVWSGARADDWDFLEKLVDDREQGGAARGMVKAVKWLAGLAEKFREVRDWEGGVNLLLKVIDENISTAMLDRSPEGRETYEAFMESVAQIRWMGRVRGAACNPADFWRAVQGALDRCGAEVYGGENGRGVALLDAMSARGFLARAVFIVGMNDGVFPRSVREDPFLRDEARSFLNNPCGHRVQLKASEGASEERLLFHLLLSLASEKTWVSWHASTADGGPALPSGFLADLASVLLTGAEPGKALEEAKELAPSLQRPRPASSATAIIRSALAHTTEVDEPGELGRLDGILDVPAYPDKGLSVTELRDAVSCPFQVYGRLVLKLRAPERTEGPWFPSPREIGNLVHAVFQHVFERKDVDWSRPDTGALVAGAKKDLAILLRKKFPEYEHLPVFLAVLEDELGMFVSEGLLSELKWMGDEGFKPAEIEQKRDGVLPLDGASLPLRGKADRLDRDTKGTVRILDYKTHTGRSEFRENIRFTPEFMQLALYGRLADAKPGGLALSILHMSAGMGGVVRQDARGMAADALEKASNEVGVKAAGLMSQGRAFPLPEGAAHSGDWAPKCGWCGLGYVCRRDHDPTRDRVEDSSEVAGLVDLVKSHGRLVTQTAKIVADPDSADSPGGKPPRKPPRGKR